MTEIVCNKPEKPGSLMDYIPEKHGLPMNDLSWGDAMRRPPRGTDTTQSDWQIRELTQQHEENARHFDQIKSSQGIFGKAADYLKNQLGLSTGSRATEAELQKEADVLNGLSNPTAGQESARNFSESYRQLTGQEWKGAVNGARLKSEDAITAYDKSQKHHVGMTTDFLGYVVTAASLYAGVRMGVFKPSTALAFSVGGNALAKAGLMQLDGPYANLPHDLALGALWGGATRAASVISKMAGERLVASRLGAGLSFETNAVEGWVTRSAASGLSNRFKTAAVNSGLSWGAFAALEVPGHLALDSLTDRSDAWKYMPARTLTGAALWTILGTAAESVLTK